jgi:alkyl hydroperoxide reductase subunit AhpC
VLARILSLGLLCVFSSLSAQPPGSDSILKVSVGDIAPDFELKEFMGNRIALSEFRGRKFVVLAFYVFAFTQGCGDELVTLQKRISGPDTQIIGISMDSIFCQCGVCVANWSFVSSAE